MKRTSLIVLALAVAASARADFSYQSERKSGNTAAPDTTKYSYKGQKMMVETSDSVILTDFDKQTITRLNRAQKTYSVMKFSEVGQATAGVGDVQVDVKETGQKKMINGYNASQVMMTMGMDMTQRGQGMKMQMEMELWISPDVPGAAELRAFYERNGQKFPWRALAQGGNSSMAKAMSDLQRKMADLHGIPVEQIIRMKPGGSAEQSEQMQQAMVQARARLEEMAKQGGQQGQMAQQALARMGAAPGGGAMVQITMESSHFSTASIPDSAFAIPADYKEAKK
ncbi:MAG TPA: DUF4412 domain-containing protein [Bryobacteraceae bacterium]|jgi:hypothetical protein|nr:DUF4412 domain-containing protein [Bryobacteraceae bacterium]